MTVVVAERVCVDFPILGASSRSIKKTVMRAATGGVLGSDSANMVIVKALDDVSFNFHDGDRVGLVGHNGSGKSTLLRVIAGAYTPVSGSMRVNGKVGSMISITQGMDFEASGLENIKLRGVLMGFKKREIDNIIDDIVDFADLGDFIHMPMRTYSSGMAMRLAFALATAGTSDVVLMDEWVSAGDSTFAEKANARLRARIDRAKVFVLASHDENLINNNCNLIMRMHHGKVINIQRILI